MNYEQLKANYAAAYRIILRERSMRDRVFAADQHKRDAKMAEMDKLLELIDDMKDELKKYIKPDMEQDALFEMAKKVEYP